MVACIRYEDWLEGISKYLQWKFKMSAILKDNKIWRFFNSIVVVPTTYPIYLDLHKRKEAKYQMLILDGVKESLIPHLAEKKTTKEIWDALKNLYEAKNETRKMALRINCMIPRWIRGRVCLLILPG